MEKYVVSFKFERDKGFIEYTLVLKFVSPLQSALNQDFKSNFYSNWLQDKRVYNVRNDQY